MSKRSPPLSPPQSPRKRNTRCELYIEDSRVEISNVVEFINNTMRSAGLSQSIRNSNAIIGSKLFGNMWCLYAASEEIAEKAAFMNGIRFNDRVFKIERHRSHRVQRFSCWNEFFLDKYGRNDPVIDREVFVSCTGRPMDKGVLQNHLHKKMVDFDLQQGNRPSILHIRRLKTRGTKFLFEMASPELAERLCYLSGISFEGTNIGLERSNDWKNLNGPPKYRNYQEFLKERRGQRILKPGQKRRHEEMEKTSLLQENIVVLADDDDDDDDEIEVLEGTKRSRKENDIGEKLEKNRLVLAKLSKIGFEKLGEAADLEIELKDIQHKLSTQTDKITELQGTLTKKTSLLTTWEEIRDQIKADIDKQEITLKEKRKEKQSLDERILRLREHNTNVTASILEEERQKKEVRNLHQQLESQDEEKRRILASVKRQEDALIDA